MLEWVLNTPLFYVLFCFVYFVLCMPPATDVFRYLRVLCDLNVSSALRGVLLNLPSRFMCPIDINSLFGFADPHCGPLLLTLIVSHELKLLFLLTYFEYSAG